MPRAPKGSNGYTLEIGEKKMIAGTEYTAYFILDRNGATMIEGSARGEGEAELTKRLNSTLLARLNNPRNYKMRQIPMRKGKDADPNKET